jgi:hypothetical protein
LSVSNRTIAVAGRFQAEAPSAAPRDDLLPALRGWSARLPDGEP